MPSYASRRVASSCLHPSPINATIYLQFYVRTPLHPPPATRRVSAMFSLQLLPPVILFEIALLLNLADLTSVVHVLTGDHRQAVIDAFKSRILRAIISRDAVGVYFGAWGPSLTHPNPNEWQLNLVRGSRSPGNGPIKICISAPGVDQVPFLIDTASRFQLVIEQPDYQYSAIRFVSTRTLTQQTYDSTVIEYNNSTGQRTYKIAMPNSTDQHAPFRRLLADHMDILVYTQDEGGARERKIMRVEFFI
jgi:hypothetical protein